MRLWLMDMKDGTWVIENKSRRFIGNDFDSFQNAILGLNKNEHILFNGKLNKLVKMFNEGGLSFKNPFYEDDYRFASGRDKRIFNVRYVRGNKNIIFRDFADFFAINFNGEIDNNLKLMWKEVDEFVKLSGYRTFYHRRSMEDIIRQDWREMVGWDKNFKDKLTEKDFWEMKKWVGGSFRFVNQDYIAKVVKTKSFDVNSYYQSIWETYPIPAGKPIRDWKSGHCDHYLQLIKCRLRGQVKSGHLPILTRKQVIFNFMETPEPMTNLFDEVFYLTGDTFDLVQEFYDLDNCEVLDTICFEVYEGDGFKKFDEKWHPIKNGTSNKNLKTLIKICENKIIGASASEKLLRVNRTFVESVDGNSEFKTIEKDLGVPSVPYIPLYLFITDFARIRMYLIGQMYLPYVVSANTDSFTFTQDLKDEEITEFIEVDDSKLGAFKPENNGEYSFYISPTHYIKARSRDKVGDITTYKWSGKKDMTLYNLSFNQAVEKIRTMKQINP